MRSYLICGLVVITLLLSGCTTTPQEIRHCDSERFPDQCIAKTSIELNRADLCNEIGASLTQGFCFDKIAEATNQVELCGKITEKYWSDICYHNLAKTRGNRALCLSVGVETRDTCYFDVALETEDPYVCQFLNNQDNRYYQCFEKVAIAREDYSICGKIGSHVHRDFCYYKYAQKKLSREACDLIVLDKVEADCFAALDKKNEQAQTQKTAA